MSYRLFIDDERLPPDDGGQWEVARSSTLALRIVQEQGVPDFISFDHDLGGDDTSMRFLHQLAELLLDRRVELPAGFAFYIHSQNPVGRDNIQAFMASLTKALSEL